LLHREVGWFLAFENAPGIDANLAVRVAEAAGADPAIARAVLKRVRGDCTAPSAVAGPLTALPPILGTVPDPGGPRMAPLRTATAAG
jgi:hypothetical protein